MTTPLDSDSAALRKLLPGTRVPTSLGVDAIVYPLGFRHLRKFTAEIGAALQAAVRVLGSVKHGSDPGDVGQAMLAQMLPYAMRELLGLLAECVVLDAKGLTLDDLPHWDVPPIVRVWLLESFGEETKWRPWVAAMDDLLTRIGGKPTTISEMLSRPSSPAESPLPTSM